MRCEVCGAEITPGKGECGYCGYPVLVQLGDSEEIRQKKQAAADDYRAKICRDIEIGFYAYTHKLVTESDGDTKLKREKSDQVRLALCGDVQTGQIAWCPEGFLRPLTDMMDCRIYIRRGTQLRGPKLLNIPVPTGSGDIQIGMEKVSDCMIRICIGRPDSHSQSEEINILTA